MAASEDNAQIGDWATEPSSDNNADGCDTFSSADAAAISRKIVLLRWDDNDATRRCGSAGRSENAAEAGATGAILGSAQSMLDVGIFGAESIPVVLSNAEGTNAVHEALTAGNSGLVPTPSKKGTRLTVTADSATAGSNPRLLVIHHLNSLANKA